MVSKLAKFLMQIYRKISENFALISLMAKNNAELTGVRLNFMVGRRDNTCQHGL